jgi:hypothetical protein
MRRRYVLLSCLAGLLVVVIRAEGSEVVRAFAPHGPRPHWYVDVQTYSFHERTSEVELHNTTPGIGLLRRQDGWLAGAGVFRNSLGRWAGYGYGGYQWEVGPVLAGGIAGATHHYNANRGGIVPLAAGVVTVPLSGRCALDLIAIPRVANYTYATLNLSVSWRFR